MNNIEVLVHNSCCGELLSALSIYTTKILKPNISQGTNTLSLLDFDSKNVKYVIKWNYDLLGGTITIPKNCILEFDGGSISNGTVIGQDTLVINVGNVDIWGEDLEREGTWKEHFGGEEDKPYDPEAHSGLGKKFLRLKLDGSNILIQDDFNQENTIYVIQYDFDLGGESVTIPENCILEFDGGSISNGTLVGQNTILIYNQELDTIFHTVTRQGTFVYNTSADEEDITEVGNLLKLKDRGTADGMGKIILRKNKTFAEQLTQTNTIYRIMYDYDLGGESVTIPENCVLEFDGGSISNGVLTGQNTVIGEDDKVRIFGDDLSLAGTWNVKEGYPEWFGCVPDDNTIDATPAIKKLVYTGMSVQFSDGTYYLSECLINGIKGVVLRGTGTHYKEGTNFKAFNASGQRFILKLGGREDFENPGEHKQEYQDIWCSNFILTGIRFNTYSTTLINADQTETAQNYAAVCFDFCVDGYVDVKTGGACPGVFIANTWEVYFENIVLYGSYTGINESALYFGKAYSNFVASNISAVTINNLFAETIYGKVVDGNNRANMALTINNIEFEPRNGNPSNVSHSGSEAYSIIENNIRTMDVLYYFNFPSYVTIHSLTYTGQSVTYENDTIARGILRSSTSGGHVVVDKIFNNSWSNVTNIYGAAGYGKLIIDKIESETNSGTVQIYTVKSAIPDFSNIYNGLPGNETGLGTVTIKRSLAIVDKDIIKEYKKGLVFNSENPEEVVTLQRSNNRSAVIFGYVDNIAANLVYFRSLTLSRKFRFIGKELIFRYTATNKWKTENIIIRYYENDAVIHTDSIHLIYSDTQLLEYKYVLYTESYDYCTIEFDGSICIDSVEVTGLEEDKVVICGSKISSDVIDIMSHYVRDDAYKRTALQYFFNKIGNIKAKLNHMLLPIFSNDINEAIYDVIQNAPLYSISGRNYAAFDRQTRRVYMTLPGSNENWSKIGYDMYEGDSGYQHSLTILSMSDVLGGEEAEFPGAMFYGLGWITPNTAAESYLTPTTEDNKKIAGFGAVSDNGVTKVIRLGDSTDSDKTTNISFIPDTWISGCQIFGQIPDSNTKGVRILVSTDQLLTVEEAKLLRDAVIELDDKFAVLDEVNDNYTSAVEKLLIPNSGTWNDKPSSADISVGFAYFCTDKQTEEGTADGIMIYYKGQDTTDPDNPVDVWVDALGRVVS